MLEQLTSRFERIGSFWQGAVRRIAGGALTVLAIQAGGAILAYVLEVVAARVLGTQEYGYFAYAIGWVTVMSLPVTFGMHTAAVKLVPRFVSNGRPDHLLGLFRSSGALALTGGLVLGVPAMTAVVSQTTLPWSAVGLTTLLSATLIPLLALSRIQMGFAKGLDSMAWAYAPKRLAVPSLVIGLLGGAAWLGLSGFTAADIIYLYLASLVLATACQAAFIRRRIGAESSFTGEATYKIKQWLKLGLPLLAVTSSVALLNRTDILVLGVLEPGSTVGRYNAASRTAKALGMFLNSVNAVGAPLISKLHGEGRQDELERVTSTLTHAAFWPTVAAALVLSFGADFVLSLFGAGFPAARDVLLILIVGYVLNASFGPVAYLLNMTGHERAVALVIGAAVAVNGVLCFALIPIFGSHGAAISSAIAILSWNVGLWWLARQRLGIDSWVGSILVRRGS